jgi:hypothetical protein
MTTYYPTIEGMKQTQKSDFDPSSDSGAYMFNELMSKPWTEEDYLREHQGQGSKQWGQPDQAVNIWRTSLQRGFISNNPEDNFYTIRSHSTHEEQVEFMKDPTIRERAAKKYPYLFD